MNETVKKNLALIAKQSKSERLYRKTIKPWGRGFTLFKWWKENHEIADILGLNEKNDQYVQIAY
jgi:hypothetical protein